MLVILANLEAENRRIMVQGHIRQKAQETSSQPKLCVITHTCHPKLHGRLRFGG
jgi:hypothetical protein